MAPPLVDNHGPEKRRAEDHPFEGYALALQALCSAGVPHLVGGGLVVQYYGRRRSTKDLDIFIRPQHADVAMHALSSAGFTTMETDANWLRKASRYDAYIDLILTSAGPIELTAAEVERGLEVEMGGVPMRIFRPEDLLLRKVHIIRDEGPDWLDAFSILEANAGRLDWGLLERPGLDPRPLAAFLLLADLHGPGMIPPHVITRQLRMIAAFYRAARPPMLPAARTRPRAAARTRTAAHTRTATRTRTARG